MSLIPIPRLGLPRRLAAITALLAILLVAGTTELALSLAERSRMEDLREESVDLATTLAAYLTRISPLGDRARWRSESRGGVGGISPKPVPRYSSRREAP